jgi:hypothetical protein
MFAVNKVCSGNRDLFSALHCAIAGCNVGDSCSLGGVESDRAKFSHRPIDCEFRSARVRSVVVWN